MKDISTSEGKHITTLPLSVSFSDILTVLSLFILATDDSNLLVLILDTNPFVWAESAKAETPLSLDDALRQILIFINAHLALKYNNKIVVIASHVGHRQVKASYLFPVSCRGSLSFFLIPAANSCTRYQAKTCTTQPTRQCDAMPICIQTFSS